MNSSFPGPGPSGIESKLVVSAPTADQLDRYLAGDAALEEVTEVQRWLTQFSDHREAIAALRTLRGGQKSPSWNAQSRWQGIAASLADQAARGRPLARGAVVLPRRSNSVWHRVWGTRGFMGVMAASLLAVAGIVSWNLVTRSAPRGNEFAMMSTYTTANGERATITLPDGSQVTLNVGSRLEVPAAFGTATRTVRLAGEAVFDVEPSQKTPFVVLAGSSTTRVLGTRFLVRHYVTDSSTMIAVQSGRVAVGATVLVGQQQVTVSAARMVTMQPMEQERFGFVDGVLRFDGKPLAAVLPDLNRWYNADIRLGDQELASRIVVGGFPSGSVTDLVSMLEWTFNVRVVRAGRVLTLYSGAK